MTGPDETGADHAGMGVAAEAAEIAAFLAAEAVANDYHPSELAPDEVAG